jgi:D-glycerate 3-kinase
MSQYLDFISKNKLDNNYLSYAEHWFSPALKNVLLHQKGSSPFFLGINGAQGSGKSTLAEWLKVTIESTSSLSVVIVSLDDFYLSKLARRTLAAEIHPLLKTRGVPGTHDLKHALAVFAALKNGLPCKIPRFNKLLDDIAPQEEWQNIAAPVDIVIFEGWCIGCPPQFYHQLHKDVNKLESQFDSTKEWRTFANEQLKAYQSWFAYINHLWMLQAPSFASIFAWRKQQEELLAANAPEQNFMNDEQLAYFIQHYQRLTEHSLLYTPQYAQEIYLLDDNRQIISHESKS